MRRLVLAALFFLIFSAPANAQRVIVSFSPGVGKAGAVAALKSGNASQIHRLGGSHALIYAADVAAPESLSWDARVKTVEPDRAVAVAATNDPFLANVWSLRPPTEVPGGADVASLWSKTTGAGVTVAVLDSGVQLDHPDLKGSLWVNSDEIPGNGVDDDKNGYVDDVNGYDFAGRDADPSGTYWHGTHVAGTIAATANNGEGIAGAAYGAKLMILQVMGDNNLIAYSDAIEALYYAAKNGAQIVNCSWGGDVNSPALKQAVVDLATQNVLVVAAVGNSGKPLEQSPFYPAIYNLPNEIAVAATDSNGALASFSNYSPTLADLAAPGQEIASTYPNSSYAVASGTSMAAPLVSAVAALLKAAKPSATAGEIRQAILDGATKDPALASKVREGRRLSAAGALAVLLKGVDVEPVDLTPPAAAKPLSPASLFRIVARSTTGVRLTAKQSKTFRLAVTLRWKASPDKDVASYRIYIDKKLRATVKPGAALRLALRFGVGTHSWGIITVDKAGNKSVSGIVPA